jgi:small conductance mechanosensitive channel
MMIESMLAQATESSLATKWFISGGVLIGTTGLIVLLGWLFFGRKQELTRIQLRTRGAIIAVLFVVSLLAVILTLPASDQLKNALIGLVGLSFAALITLGSTTIFANFMAGVMMYHVRSFRPGDYIRVGGHMGRVTAKGLFHVEIQTEDRDLVTLPNSFLITNPVRVVRSSGTIISCELSLGYDVPNARVEPLLLKAIKDTDLADGFVQVISLGDFAVTYRACGLLEDTKRLITQRSNLKENVLDTLHEAGIEIVSPSFMNQRRVHEAVIPARVRTRVQESANSPEDVVFDKADDAERLGNIRESLTEAKAKIKELDEQMGGVEGDDKAEQKAAIKADIEHQKKLVEYLTSQVARMEG